MLEREVALYKRLQTRGFKISFVTYGGEGELAFADRLEGIGILCNRDGLPMDQYAEEIPDVHAKTLRNVDLVKTNQTPGAQAAVKTARAFGVPLVARCGYLASEFAVRDFGDESEQARIARETEKLAFTHAARVVLTTTAMKGSVVAAYGIPDDRVSVVPNYVMTDQFKPGPVTERIPNRICAIGRPGKQKNFPALFKALDGLPVTLVMVGGAVLSDELREMASQMDLDVVFKGNVPHGELPKELNQAGLYVMPSLWEGHPKALIEAMACGLPVIGGDSPGIRGLIRHNETGWLCNTESGDIRASVERLLGDGALCRKLGENARAQVEAEFSLDRVIDLEFAALNAALSAQ